VLRQETRLDSDNKFTGKHEAEFSKITSFSLLFLIPRTRSVKFLSNIRSKLPFTLRNAMVAFKKLNAVSSNHLKGFLAHQSNLIGFDRTTRGPDHHH
jgi:hypothetical protein